MRLLVAIAIAAGLWIAPAAALAEKDPALREAKQHFYRGEKLFALGRFDDALVAYEAAFEAKAIPAFLFNIGQCHRNLGDYRSAVFSFRKYLKLQPEAANREAVEELIDELEAEMGRADRDRRARDGTALVPTAPGPDSPEARPFYARWWFWGGVAAAAAVGTGVYLYSDGGGIPDSDFGNVDFSR